MHLLYRSSHICIWFFHMMTSWKLQMMSPYATPDADINNQMSVVEMPVFFSNINTGWTLLNAKIVHFKNFFVYSHGCK